MPQKEVFLPKSQQALDDEQAKQAETLQQMVLSARECLFNNIESKVLAVDASLHHRIDCLVKDFSLDYRRYVQVQLETKYQEFVQAAYAVDQQHQALRDDLDSSLKDIDQHALDIEKNLTADMGKKSAALWSEISALRSLVQDGGGPPQALADKVAILSRHVVNLRKNFDAFQQTASQTDNFPDLDRRLKPAVTALQEWVQCTLTSFAETLRPEIESSSVAVLALTQKVRELDEQLPSKTDLAHTFSKFVAEQVQAESSPTISTDDISRILDTVSKSLRMVESRLGSQLLALTDRVLDQGVRIALLERPRLRQSSDADSESPDGNPADDDGIIWG